MRWTLWLPVSLLAGSIAVASPGARAEVEGGTPDTTVGPLISGTASYVDGVYAWTDYAYDDRGPNSDGAAGGDGVYPDSSPEGNAADLVQLQVSRSGARDLRVRAVLETLLDPGVPVLTVGVDVDGKAGTGAATLPGWQADAPLGLDVVVSTSSGDVATNALEVIVPEVTGRTARVVASIGVTGDDVPYDLAFVRAEDVCAMPSPGAPAQCVPNPDNQLGQDHRQSDVLAGRLPASAAVATIDLTKLRRGVTELARVDGRGFHSLLYHSDLDLGEGVRSQGGGPRSVPLPHDLYAGAWQPYVIRVPRPIDGPLPAIVYLHGRSGNHLQGFVSNFATFDPDAIVVGVLGRGPEVGYGGIDWSGFIEPEGAYGERDVLDVIADLKDRGLIDPDRIVIGGISMGGVGAFHLAELHPDLFAAVLPIVGGDAGILPVNWGPGLIENLSNMPMRMANGVIDPLAHVGSQLTPALLHELRTVDFRAWEALRRHHEWQAGLVDCVWNELLARPRVTDPARVIYGVNPAFEVSFPETGLEARHRRAYWVSGLTPRTDPLDRSVTSPPTSRIDVTSLARADRATEAAPVAELGENLTAGADYCGPSELRSNDAWEMNGLILTPGPPQPTSNGMDLTILRFDAATLDLSRMGIAVHEPVEMTVTGDGTSSITLRGPWPDGGLVELTRDGEPARTIEVVGGAVVVTEDFTGTHGYTLTLIGS